LSARRLALALPLLTLAGCAGFDSFMSSLGGGSAMPPLESRPREAPIEAHVFELASPDQTIVGEPQVVFTRAEDTLSDLAREYGLGYDELLAANPGVDPWLPGADTAILLPTQYVLPDVPREGLVLNIATKRLFYFPPAADDEAPTVMTFPIGIGRVGWETPVGETAVTAKARDPHWWVPASVRREHAEVGDILPEVVPPGPDNPLGNRVLQLGMPGYLIHGTNQPFGVGMRVSHGCVRLYPENIEFLFELVDVGTPVRIVNEPFLVGRRDGAIYFEAHAPLEEDEMPADVRLEQLLDGQRDAAGMVLNPHLREHMRVIAAEARGVPVNVLYYDTSEVFARVRVVENTVETDPDAPSLSEVREMMREVEAEIASESAETL